MTSDRILHLGHNCFHTNPSQLITHDCCQITSAVVTAPLNDIKVHHHRLQLLVVKCIIGPLRSKYYNIGNDESILRSTFHSYLLWPPKDMEQFSVLFWRV
jgi:hypothetical protein